MGNKCCQDKTGKFPNNEEEKKNMEKPYTVRRYPQKVKLQPGKEYYWCSCGLSKSQPFCDGSHQGSPYQPTKFTAEKNSAHMCMCKQTKTAPYCDKTHLSLLF